MPNGACNQQVACSACKFAVTISLVELPVRLRQHGQLAVLEPRPMQYDEFPALPGRRRVDHQLQPVQYHEVPEAFRHNVQLVGLSADRPGAPTSSMHRVARTTPAAWSTCASKAATIPMRRTAQRTPPTWPAGGSRDPTSLMQRVTRRTPAT